MKIMVTLILCMILISNQGYSNLINNLKPKLLIKIPTRQRPYQFFNVLETYYKNLSNTIPCFFVITCDIDDTSMNNDLVKNRLNNYPNLYYYFGHSQSKVEAYNNDINKHIDDFDILIVTSDDTRPCKDYDQILVNLMIANFPDFDGVINFHDGHVKRILNTLPVIGQKYYKRFRYIYHPSYKSLWCDNELTVCSQILKKEYYKDQIIIEHLHPVWSNGIYDALYLRNEKFFFIDKANFEQRQKRNFDLHLMNN